MRRCLEAFGLCLVLSVITTWGGALYDNPLSAAVVDGMNARECASVSSAPRSSILTASIPDDDICLPCFIYRVSYQDAASNEHAYRAWVLERRVAEFWQLIGYVLLLWAMAMGGIGLVAWIVIRLVRHCRTSWHKPTTDHRQPRQT